MKERLIQILAIMIISATGSQAAVLDYLSPVDPTNPKKMRNNNPQENMYSTVTHKARLTQNDIKNQYTIAMQRFMQTNVKSAYADFKMLIKHIVPNDYAYLRLADEMAEIGLFNLSNDALEKASDKEISYIHSGDIKKFYFPKNMVDERDEIYLAEVYSNIMYNAQGKEATSELLKNSVLMEKSDYANYIAALGLFKTGETKNAEIYINKALKINPDNINYQKLKIEIAVQDDKNSDAIKTLANIKKSKFYTSEFIKKISILEEYTLYKTEKNDTLKKYHLGYYYHNLGEEAKAIRTLQGAISSKKNYNKQIYGLIAEVYYTQKEYEKAYNFADKSIQLGGNNPLARMVLGKVCYRNQEYKAALNHFKSVKPTDSNSQVWLAMSYTALGEEKQARELYYKILKEKADCADAYYNVAIRDKEREQEYYKRAVTVNLNHIDGWVGLAKYAIEKNNLAGASKYLEIVKYIDENDFRYYYYQGLVFKAKGYYQDANYYFHRSLVINPDNELAKKELGI